MKKTTLLCTLAAIVAFGAGFCMSQIMHSSDAELIDARIAVGGKTYDNLGNAIRGQIKNLKDSFENEFEAYKNLLKLK